jgi:hypothetical protein
MRSALKLALSCVYRPNNALLTDAFSSLRCACGAANANVRAFYK